MKHTKTPWRFTKVDTDMNGNYCTPELKSGRKVIAQGGQCQWTGLIVFDKKEDMDFLLHAANNYDQLVEMLKEIKGHGKGLFGFLKNEVRETLEDVGELVNG